MMTKFFAKCFMTVFVGTLGLGFSTQAQADDLNVNWLFAQKKLDCPSTCSQNRFIKYAMPTGYDKNLRKATFFICITEKKNKGWHPGFNVWGQNACTTTFDGEEYQGTSYFCLCTNNRSPKIFR